ncbi:MAG: citrate/2-methylcitrate synthase [Ruminococcaceae bacterium]|nr:citrate/2-methylcitrate synthase [Oscillospiraceae bacterium]
MSEILKMAENIEGFNDKITESYRPLSPSLYDKYNVQRGLRRNDGTGVMAGLTSIGDVKGYVIEDGEKIPCEGRLRYRGVDVRDIVEACQKEKRFGFEEVAFLLLSGFLPNRNQYNAFKELIGSQRMLPDGFAEDMIMKAPSANIMNKLARCVLASYSYDPNPDDTSFANIFRQSIELIARFPTMVAYGYQAKRHYHDKQSLYIHQPQSDLSTAENFLYMIRPDNKYTELEAEILDLALILHAEHGGGNNSAFATRVLSSSGTDTYSAIAAAVGSLKGPKHGGANQRVMGMIEDFKENLSDINDVEQVRDHIVKILKKESYDKSGLVYGMGHAIYTLSDPREVMLKKKAYELAQQKGMMEEFMLYDLIEKHTPELFASVTGHDKTMCANVDLYSGLVYKMLDLPQELYTPLFAIARIVGWSAHRIEEITTNTKIMRPAYKSVTSGKGYVTIDER